MSIINYIEELFVYTNKLENKSKTKNKKYINKIILDNNNYKDKLNIFKIYNLKENIISKKEPNNLNSYIFLNWIIVDNNYLNYNKRTKFLNYNKNSLNNRNNNSFSKKVKLSQLVSIKNNYF